MAQVDSENTTTTPVAPTRRRFLTVAAAGNIGGLTPVIAEPAAAPAIDPIYAVIDRHRKAAREHNEAVDIHMAFEELGMEGEKLAKYKRLVATTAAAYDELEDAPGLI
jgi:hypothetical protein